MEIVTLKISESLFILIQQFFSRNYLSVTSFHMNFVDGHDGFQFLYF